MEEKSREQLWGAISALNHMLVTLWEGSILATDDPLNALKNARKTTLEEFEPENARNHAGSHGFAVGQYGIDFLEKFWAQVEERVRDQSK